MADKIVALKVDVDTYAGTRDGVPNLLADMARFGVKATFYFSMGPDNSGKALRRIFTRKGVSEKTAPQRRTFGLQPEDHALRCPAPRAHDCRQLPGRAAGDRAAGARGRYPLLGSCQMARLSALVPQTPDRHGAGASQRPLRGNFRPPGHNHRRTRLDGLARFAGGAGRPGADLLQRRGAGRLPFIRSWPVAASVPCRYRPPCRPPTRSWA